MNSIWGNSISPGITILTNQIFTMYTSNGVNIDFTGKVVPGKKKSKDIQPISTVLELYPFKKKVMSFILTI